MASSRLPSSLNASSRDGSSSRRPSTLLCMADMALNMQLMLRAAWSLCGGGAHHSTSRQGIVHGYACICQCEGSCTDGHCQIGAS